MLRRTFLRQNGADEFPLKATLETADKLFDNVAIRVIINHIGVIINQLTSRSVEQLDKLKLISLVHDFHHHPAYQLGRLSSMVRLCG